MSFQQGFRYPIGTTGGGGGAPPAGSVGLMELAAATEDPGVLVYEGGMWVYKAKERIIGWVWTVARNANATDIWLRTTNGVPTNVGPLVAPYDGTLIGISASTPAAETWDAEIYKNADVRAGGIPTDGNKIAELVLAAVDAGKDDSVSVDVDADDEIGVFMRGTAVNRPVVNMFFVRRD